MAKVRKCHEILIHTITIHSLFLGNKNSTRHSDTFKNKLNCTVRRFPKLPLSLIRLIDVELRLNEKATVDSLKDFDAITFATGGTVS